MVRLGRTNNTQYFDRLILVIRIMKPFKIGRFCVVSATLVSCLVGSFAPSYANAPLTRTAIIKTFDRISRSTTLANPSILLMDLGTGEVVYEKNADYSRKPASVMKLLSAAVALQYLNPDARFSTSLSLTSTPRTLVLNGHFDPWMASHQSEVVEYKRASLSYLGKKVIEKIKTLEGRSPRNLTIKFSGVYIHDTRLLAKYLRLRGVNAKFIPITSEESQKLAIEKFASTISPPVKDMVEFALLWSDNALANRLALEASTVMGYPRSETGISSAVTAFLNDLQIDTTGLKIRDGSGLSKKNRVTVEMVADLLLKVRGNADFAPLYAGLPVSGISGTLEDRYLTTAPQAVGLIHAKTGTLDGTVSLAGYVDSGLHEYIFVAIADHIHKGTVATNRARRTIDRLLGTIAAPLITNSQYLINALGKK